MRLDKILHKVLDAHRRRLEAASVTVVEETDSRDVELGVSSKKLVRVTGEVIDRALKAMASVPERRLVVRSRRANCGGLVEIEYTGTGAEEPSTAARVCHETEEEATRELAKYRDVLGQWGGRVFTKAIEGRNTRYIIEVPAPGRAEEGNAA